MPVFRRTDGRRSPAEAVAQLRAASAVHLRERAAAARRRAALLLPLVVAVVLVERYPVHPFHPDEPVRLGCAVFLVGPGAWVARGFCRAPFPPVTRGGGPAPARAGRLPG